MSKEKILNTFSFGVYEKATSCSGCRKEKEDCIYVGGNLVGSGSKPYLVLCPECKVILKEKL